MFDFISSVPFEVNRGQRSPYNKKLEIYHFVSFFIQVPCKKSNRNLSKLIAVDNLKYPSRP